MVISINADDFGRDESTSKAILLCFDKGYISSTTLMVNMPWAESAVKLADERKLLDNIGLHLNLCEGVPLTDKIREIPIFCECGVFNQKFLSSRRSLFFLMPSEIKALKEEIEAQIEKFLGYGLSPAQIDSHCHTHNALPVLLVVISLAHKYGFQRIRAARNIASSKNVFSTIYKAIVNVILSISGLRATQYFSSFKDFSALEKKVGSINGTVELMCHPVYDEVGHIINEGSQSFEAFFDFMKNNSISVKGKL